MPIHYEPSPTPIYIGGRIKDQQDEALRELQKEKLNIERAPTKTCAEKERKPAPLGIRREVIPDTFYSHPRNRMLEARGREITRTMLDILLRIEKPITAPDLANMMGLTRAPIYRRLREHSETTSVLAGKKRVWWHIKNRKIKLNGQGQAQESTT